MAASGGFWIKGSGGASAGKLFVPAMKQGAGASIKVGPVAGEYVNGISQGHMILHKAPNKTGQYWISNMTTGETVVKGLKTEAVGKAALETMHMVGGIKNPDPKVGATYTGKTNADIPPLQSKLLNKEGQVVEHGQPKTVDKTALAAKKAAAATAKIEAQMSPEAKEAGLSTVWQHSPAEMANIGQKYEGVKIVDGVPVHTLVNGAGDKIYFTVKKDNVVDLSSWTLDSPQKAAAMAIAKKAAAAPAPSKPTAKPATQTKTKPTPEEKKLTAIQAKMSEQAVNTGVEGSNLPKTGTAAAKSKTLNKAPKAEKEFDAEPAAPSNPNVKTISAAEIASIKAPPKQAGEAQNWQTGQVQITTKAGKKESLEGYVNTEAGYAVTQNAKTGKYHLVDTATGQTVSIHAKQTDAFSDGESRFQSKQPEAGGTLQHYQNKEFSVAKDYQPPNGYEAWSSKDGSVYSTGIPKMMNDYDDVANNITSAQKTALAGYQDGEYQTINGHLWKQPASAKPGSNTIANMDAIMAKSATKRDLIAVRAESSGHPLSQMVNKLSVGDVYHAKGFDSAMIATDNSWGSAAKVIYRVPKGTPSVYVDAVTHSGIGEHELLFDRNLAWKVIGKHTYGSQTVIEVEFLGKVVP